MERARGHLYSFHQLSGSADLALQEGVAMLRAAGHAELAEEIDAGLVGRNVLPDRWTYQVVEEYDDAYWSVFREYENKARQTLAGGRRHLYEADMKDRERAGKTYDDEPPAALSPGGSARDRRAVSAPASTSAAPDAAIPAVSLPVLASCPRARRRPGRLDHRGRLGRPDRAGRVPVHLDEHGAEHALADHARVVELVGAGVPGVEV